MNLEVLFLLLTTPVAAFLYEPILNTNFTYNNTMNNLHDLVKLDALSVFDHAVRFNMGMLITATANDTVQFALTKCGRPLFTRFYGTESVDYLTPEAVRNLHLRFVTDCIRNMPPEIRDQTIDITYVSQAPIQSLITFQPANHSLPDDRTVTFHNISAKIMTTVNFRLKANSANIYPVKLAGLIESIANKTNKYLQMTVTSPRPVNFFFSKCDFTITHFPTLTDDSIVFDERMVNFMDLLQNENCERWMWKTMELHLAAGDEDTAGTITFDAVNEHPDQYGFDFHQFLASVCFAIVFTITIASVAFVLARVWDVIFPPQR